MLLATVVLQPPFSVVIALIGGQVLMWSVSQGEPVKLAACGENPAVAEPLPCETDPTPGWQRREWVHRALKHNWDREVGIVLAS